MGPDPLLQPCCRLGVDGSINLQSMEWLTIIIFINQPDGPASLPSHRLLEEFIQTGLRQVPAQEEADIQVGIILKVRRVVWRVEPDNEIGIFFLGFDVLSNILLPGLDLFHDLLNAVPASPGISLDLPCPLQFLIRVQIHLQVKDIPELLGKKWE